MFFINARCNLLGDVFWIKAISLSQRDEYLPEKKDRSREIVRSTECSN